MGLNIKEIIADENLLEEGVLLDYDKEAGAKVRIAYIDARKYTDKLAKMTMAARRRTKGRDIPAGVYQKVVIEAMAGTILLDWEGFLDEEGNVLQFTDANAQMLLTRSKHLRDFVQEESMLLDNFQQAKLAEGEGKAEGAVAEEPSKSAPTRSPSVVPK